MRTNHDSISNVDNFGANGGPPVVKHESGVDSKSEIWTLSELKTIRGEHRPVERSPVRYLHGRSAAIHACMIHPIALSLPYHFMKGSEVAMQSMHRVLDAPVWLPSLILIGA